MDLTRNKYYIDNETQEKIGKVKILLAGAGLGSNIAECLVRMGCKNITVIDFDIVESHNLNRQNYTYSDIGRLKVDRIHDRLLSINPDCSITRINSRIDVDPGVKDFDIIVNCIDVSDDSAARKLTEAGLLHGKYVIHPFNLGISGEIIVFTPDASRSSDLNNLMDTIFGGTGVLAKFLGSEAENMIRTTIQNNYNFIPQLAIASWYIAGGVADIVKDICSGESISTRYSINKNTSSVKF